METLKSLRRHWMFWTWSSFRGGASEKPVRGSYHGFFKHHHLSFDGDAGRQEFQETINRIFRRNGLAYELTAQGRVERLAPPVLREELASAQFHTPDPELNRMLEQPGENFWTLTRRRAARR